MLLTPASHQVMGRRVAGSSFAQGLAASLKPGDQLNMFTGSRDAQPALQPCCNRCWQQGAQVQLHPDLDPTLIAGADAYTCPIQGCTTGAGCGPMGLPAASLSLASPIPSAPIG